MKKERTVRIQDLIGLVHALYPADLAEEWDNVGLQVGDPAAAVQRVLVCLDPTSAALRAAEEAGAQAVLSHHPLIFRPLKSLSPRDESGKVLMEAVRKQLAVIAAHTNLDRARGGLNDWLAAALGLAQAQPLQAGGEELLKLVVYLPAGYEGRVSEALFAAGAGQIGRYSHCSFAAAGIGTFRPETGTTPFIGTPGRTERVHELRMETVLPRAAAGRAVRRLLKAHPYEEVAYDLIPLANRREDVGLGRIGRLPAPVALGVYAQQVKETLGGSALRLVGDRERAVSKVALCGGSGASLIGEAVRQGADVLVTGDVKYHEAQAALSQGLAVIDAGHFGTERIAVAGMVEALGAEALKRKLPLEFVAMKGEEDPFTAI